MKPQRITSKIAITLMLCSLSCVSTTEQKAEKSEAHSAEKKSKKEIRKKARKEKKKKSIARIELPQPLKNPEESAKRHKFSAKAKKQCRSLLKHAKAPIKKLYQTLKNRRKANKTKITQILKLKISNCNDPKKIRSTIQTLSKSINHHSSKVGVILPNSTKSKPLTDAIINGILASAQKFDSDPEKTIVFKDSQGSQKGALKALAELILEDQVSMVITGLESIEATTITPISKRLMIPTLVINGNHSLIKRNKYAFQVFPQQKHLARRMADLIHRRHFKKIAIFRPANGHSDALLASLQRFLSAEQFADVEITHDLKYFPGDFDSMERAVKQVAGIDYIKRKEEFELAYKEAKEKALEDGVPFKAKQVILPADLQADVVLIPDSFRMAHHFSNVFKYHGVNKMPFIGNHEWRAQGLVDPWQSFLHGSYFVDFIGDYQHLPTGIGSLSTDSSYFTTPSEASTLDFQLIGYRTGAIAFAALKPDHDRRRDLQPELKSMRSKEGFFTESLIFDRKRSSYWPTYLFSVNNRSLILINSANFGSNYTWPKKVKDN